MEQLKFLKCICSISHRKSLGYSILVGENTVRLIILFFPPWSCLENVPDIFMRFGKSASATTKGYHALLSVDCVKEIRGSCCHVLWPLEGTDKPYISLSLGLGVSRLFEHEKLAGPSDTGHYVVTTRLFHHSWAKWDVVLGQRANLQGWLFTVEPPSGMVGTRRELCN